VLVTGAGGSIGSELCRQIAALDPSEIVLYERYENGLYAVENDLRDRFGDRLVHAVIGDITDAGRLDGVFSARQPQVVFHAAAHKHVPLMETNPCEAVKNNVTGTRLVMEAAERHGVTRFVLVSTDKAVRPSSVMGATKRVAELLAQNLSDSEGLRVVTVRFGNVLASNGSVVPRFVDQIKAGGPVTVTHPDVRRYFMLIPEAVQLVLQAAALAEGGETFVLEMGEQIRVVDLARNLIRLSGYVPDDEIAIEYVGLRPGEKLFENLVGEDEVAEPSPVTEIVRVVQRNAVDPALLAYQILELERLAASDDAEAVLAQLRRIVPSFGASRRPRRSQAELPSGAGADRTAKRPTPTRR
jgi:FlaA1/EpsC-like NDP-sugar epimerase